MEFRMASKRTCPLTGPFLTSTFTNHKCYLNLTQVIQENY